VLELFAVIDIFAGCEFGKPGFRQIIDIQVRVSNRKPAHRALPRLALLQKLCGWDADGDRTHPKAVESTKEIHCNFP